MILGLRLLGLRLLRLVFGYRPRPTCHSAPGAAQVIEVQLIPTVVQQLKQLMATNGFSATDNINRAITVYNFVDEMLASGHDFLIRRRRAWWHLFRRYELLLVVFDPAE